MKPMYKLRKAFKILAANGMSSHFYVPFLGVVRAANKMNSQRIIIQPMYDALEIKSVKVKRKTEELMRLLDLRAAGGLRAVCIDIILQFLSRTHTLAGK